MNLRGFYRFLAAGDLCHDDPTENLRPPRVMPRPLRPYTEPEIQRFVRGLRDTRAYERNVALVMLLLSTGWRCSEIRRIRIEDIDFRQGLVRLHAEAKGGKYLVASPDTSTMQIVRRYMGRAGITSGWLFPGQNGGPLHRHTVWDIMQTGSRKTETHFDVRRWRHTFGILFLLNGGGELLDLNVLWNHSKMDTTKGYVAYVAQKRALAKQHSRNPAEALARRLLRESPPARPGRVA